MKTKFGVIILTGLVLGCGRNADAQSPASNNLVSEAATLASGMARYQELQQKKQELEKKNLELEKQIEQLEKQQIRVDFVRHVVEKGEDLNAISRTYGVRAVDVRSINGLKSDELQVGQVLKIPNPQ